MVYIYISLQIKERVEKHAWEGEHPHHQQHQTSSQQPSSTAAQKQGLHASASDLANKASDKATSARQYAGGAAERTKEVARQAAGVARVQLHRVVVVGKEKVGLATDKPLVDAAKEKFGISPDMPAREAARQVASQTVSSAWERAYAVSLKNTRCFAIFIFQNQACIILIIPLLSFYYFF